MPVADVRFGVLGAARIAPAALLRPAAAHPEVKVEVVAARDRDRAVAYAAKHRIPRVLDSYEAVVTDPTVDAVYIPLPNSLHAEWTLAALAAGKHVLCEKPFTANAAEARYVAVAAEEAARRSGLVVMEAFHYRYHPLARRMRAIVDSGDLGRIRHIEAWLCAPIPKRTDIRYQSDLAGGAMMDMGSYVVHWARLLGREEPTVLSASAKLHSPDIDRAMDAELSFPSGHTATVHCSMWSRSLLHIEARVTGEDGTMRVFNPIAPQAVSVLTVRSGGRRRFEFGSRRTTYAYQLDAFCDAVVRGEPVLTPPGDAVANMAVIDAVYRAAHMHPRGVHPPAKEPTP
ncbi:MAG TPA: Gfo/Idh/MocA family oxidoreductase [Acidimicrobiales bacterium]|jgi:predicted dehydrogenase|nr:Gfo/Idh/MocA family oxidoreductase [Acidimicrobiales bacterium]